MLFDKKEIQRAKELLKNHKRFAGVLGRIKESTAEITEEYIVKVQSDLVRLSAGAERQDKDALAEWGALAYKTKFMILPLAYYGKVAEDDNYVNAALVLLTEFCKAPVWASQGLRQTPIPWKSDLMTGDFSAQAALSYTLLKDELSQQQKSFIENAIWEKGFLPVYEEWINPKTRIHALDTMGHNWWTVCVCGAGAALMTVGQNRPHYSQYLEQIINCVREQLIYPGNILQNKFPNNGTDGDFIEYISYMLYNYTNLALLDEMLHKSTGKTPFDDLGVMEKVGQFMIVQTQFTKQGHRITEFGDTRNRIPPRDAYTILYFARKYKQGCLLEYFNRVMGELGSPLDVYFYPTDVEPKSFDDFPTAKVFQGTGTAVVRSGYGPLDDYFAMKTGGAWCHSHRDVGTFVITSGGRQFVVDSGRCTYSKPLYNEFYTTPCAHSVILKDGQGMDKATEYYGTHTLGTFPVLLDSENYRYLLADCTAPYSHLYRRFFRHTIFFERFIFMVDDVQAYESGEAQWLLQYSGNIDRQGQVLTVENGGQQMKIHTLHPMVCSYESIAGYKGEVETESNKYRVNSREWVNPQQDYLSINAPLNDDNRIKYINLFALPGAGDITATAQDLGRAIMVTIESGQSQSTIICNTNADGTDMHKNSLLTQGEIESDAFLIYTRHSKAGVLEAAALHNGSYLRIKGKTLYSSPLKVDATMEFDKTNMRLTAQTSSQTTCYSECGGSLKGYALQKGSNSIRILC